MTKHKHRLSSRRCAWVTSDPVYITYHDQEWGRPVHHDQVLFAMLCLEGAQAGLSWITVLKKRARYYEDFFDFDPVQVAAMTDAQLEEILLDPGVIRNGLKIYSVRQNALCFLQVQQEFGSFGAYLWGWVGNQPLKSHYKTSAEVPGRTELSDKISKDLKKRGFKFVGSTIVQAYLQAVGVLNDHTTDCWCYEQ